METNEICERTEDQKHCWHTGSGIDSFSPGGISKTHYKCCWCAQAKVVELNFSPVKPKQHGPYNYQNFKIDPFDPV